MAWGAVGIGLAWDWSGGKDDVDFDLPSKEVPKYVITIKEPTEHKLSREMLDYMQTMKDVENLVSEIMPQRQRMHLMAAFYRHGHILITDEFIDATPLWD